MRRGLERGGNLFGIAVVIVERDVVWHIIIELRRAGFCPVACERDRGQGIDIDHHGFGRVLRLQQGFRDHADDRIADEPHLAFGERAADRLLHLGAVAVLERHDAFEGAVGFHVVGGVDAENARHRSHAVRVDALDHAMCVRGAHHHGVSLARQVDVVGIAAVALHQHRVLGARYRLADAEFRQCEGFAGNGLFANIHAGNFHRWVS